MTTDRDTRTTPTHPPTRPRTLAPEYTALRAVPLRDGDLFRDNEGTTWVALHNPEADGPTHAALVWYGIEARDRDWSDYDSFNIGTLPRPLTYITSLSSDLR